MKSIGIILPSRIHELSKNDYSSRFVYITKRKPLHDQNRIRKWENVLIWIERGK